MKPFLGEIMITAFEFAPKGWATCDGQLLPIDQHEKLFSLIGTTYGGDGIHTFALPDLRGRTALHWSNNYPLGSSGGEEIHALALDELPAHTHTAQGNKNTANATTPVNNLWAVGKNTNAYSATGNQFMNTTTVRNAGAGQPHENMQPFLVLDYIIALEGILPPKN